MQIEKLIFAETADRRAVAAGHIVGKNLKLRPAVHRRRVAEQQRLGEHAPVGLLGDAVDDDLALEDAGCFLIKDIAEILPTFATRRRMADEERGVGVFAPAQQRDAAQRSFRIGAFESLVDLPAHKPSPRNKREAVELRPGAELRQERFETQAVRLCAGERQAMRDMRIIANFDDQHIIGLAGAAPLPQADFIEPEPCPGADAHERARKPRRGLGRYGRIDDMERGFVLRARCDVDDETVLHQGRIERDHRVVGLGPGGGKAFDQRRRALRQRRRDRHHFDAGRQWP